MAEQLQGTL